MRIHFIQHANFEGLGVIRDWAEAQGFELVRTNPFLGEAILPASEYDMLLIMGGPQSVTEFEKYPYLKTEIQAIQSAVEKDKHVLGICLGAQIIGSAYGYEGSKSPHKEVGIHPIALTDQGKKDPLLKDKPQSFDVMHWHGDMAGVGGDAEILAASPGCPRQIIKYGKKTYGFQCHLEIKKEGMQRLIKHCPEDLLPGPYIQTAEDLLAQDFEAIHERLQQMLDRFVG